LPTNRYSAYSLAARIKVGFWQVFGYLLIRGGLLGLLPENLASGCQVVRTRINTGDSEVFMIGDF
jgi:hypothetical protein